ncbi:MAG: aromatic ring-hydroxylating dioxygenase subunit alpha [Myxococcales bacterium]|nr:aromatic ring-hydroxylating dioxygenase subunit alpha [Myxococcales bacterium]
MFEGFAQVWTPVALSKDVRDEPVGMKLAGTKLVLFRGQDGKVGALVDRCPHRGVALSLGKVKDGCLVCPFHGWRFDTSGRVTDVPWNPDAKISQLRGTELPAAEAGGLVWVYTAPGGRPQSGPSAPAFLSRPELRISGFSVEWKIHWTRLMENMLDWPHLPFVHESSIGKGMRAKADSRMDIHMEERETGFLSTITVDGELQPGSLELRWPNQMVLTIADGPRTLIMMNACIPIDDEHSRLFVVTARSFLKLAPFDYVFELSNRRVVSEDRAIVGSSWPTAVPRPSEELSVRTDGPTLAFRKRYFAELYGSAAASAPGRPVPLRLTPKAAGASA